MQGLKSILRLAAGVVLLLLAAVFAQAQTNQGQLAGNVLDSTGATVGNATITAKNEANGASYTAKSSSAGNYRFPSIQLGRYTVTTTAQGFKQTVSTGVEVRVGTTTSLDVSLTTGGVTDTVTVEANAPSVETQSSEVGGTVTDRQIIELPLALGGVGAMRSPESFVFLIPGTTGPGSGNSNNGIFISKIGGGQNFGNEILLDGASQARSENGSSFDEEALSVEAIAEFKVTTSTPAAEFGRTTGGIENYVTKQGSNHVHGTVFGIFRNEALDANDWFNNGYKSIYNAVGNTAAAKTYNRPVDKQYDFGISMGAPMVIPHLYNGRDKTFAFFSWEQYRLSAGGVATSDLPTVAERGGDFSDRLINGTNGTTNPCDGSAIQNGQIFDPSTSLAVGGNATACRTAFARNVIPQARMSSVGQKIAAFYPTPNNASLTGNYSYASSSPLTNTTYTIRVDHNLGSKDKLFGSYSSRENTRYSPTFLTLPAPVDPAVQTQDFITHFGRAGWDHIFTSTILNHLNLGYNRSNSINGSIEAGTGVNYNTQLGTPFIAGFPRVDVGGYQSLSRNQLDDEIDNGIRVNDAVSWQVGRHSFKIGVDWRYQQFSPIAQYQINGYLSFQANQTKATRNGDFQNGTGNGFASLLLGLGDNAQSTVPSHQSRWISNYWAGFVQDDFKVTNSLVLNLGIRYDVDQPRREATNRTSNFSTTAIDPLNGRPGAMVFGTTCTNCNTRWADTWFKDFAPRVGFAFSPASLNNKFVLRGGFATLYGPLLYNDFGGGTNRGYTVTTVQNSNGFDPAFSVDGGISAPNPGTDLRAAYFDNGNADAPRYIDGSYIKPSYGRPAAIQQWNLQVQQELAKDLIMTLGYIGSSGSHLRSGIENINNMPMSNFARGNALTSHNLAANGVNSPYGAFNGQVQQALRPFPQYGYIATDCCLQNVGHSTYEALVASLERRFAQGLNLQASYTWSKNITNADSALPGINAGVNQEQNPFNSKSQKSLSIQDIPNTFVTSFIYELPFGRNKSLFNFNNAFARSLISGFEIGSVLRYQSGQPTSFGGATGIPGWDNFIAYTRIPGSQLASNARRGHINPFRATQSAVFQKTAVTAPDPNVDSEFNGYLVPNGIPTQTNPNPGPINAAYKALQTSPAFIDQNQDAVRIQRAVRSSYVNGVNTACDICDNGGYLFGNVARVTGEVRNYRYYNEDFSFLKKTPLTEGVTFFLKVEMLNAFNRHTFATPNTDVKATNFGVPTSSINGPRRVQLTARFQF